MEYIKVCLLNNSGNVGKSTLANYLLKPRLDADVIRVETFNTDTSNVDQKLSADDMVKVINEINTRDKAIIDIGSSNIENFLKGVKKQKGAHEDIDYYIIPVVSDEKQQQDSINTIMQLLEIGVDYEQIKIIFNRIDTRYTVQEQFQTFFNSNNIIKKLNLKKEFDMATVEETEIFSLLNQTGLDYFNVKNDNTNFKIALRKEKDLEKREILSLKRTAQRLILSLEDELDSCFEKLQLKEIELTE